MLSCEGRHELLMSRRRLADRSRSKRRTQLLIAMAAAAVAVVVLIVGASYLRSRERQGTASVSPGSTAAEAGVPVDRNVMGAPTAPLVLVEYSDFQ
jgi:protein-disulfide isomerase